MVADQSIDLFDDFVSGSEKRKEEEMSLGDYLRRCKADPKTYATAAERLLDAIGSPEIIDTSKVDDPKLARVFQNRTIARYPAFKEFFGMEDTIMSIIKFLHESKQNMGQEKKILFLLGPTGTAKSSLTEHLKSLMEDRPFYVLKAGDEVSPFFENPLGIFNVDGKQARDNRAKLQDKYGIAPRYSNIIMSPWAAKRLKEFDNDLSKFSVVKMWPSRTQKIGITRVEPSDETNQDTSELIGELDIHKTDRFSQNDPDSYLAAGGLNASTQGMMEIVEIFKMPFKVLYPLISATADKKYEGGKRVGDIPYQGFIISHSNESEYKKFIGNPDNAAIKDRIYKIDIPYTLKATQEKKIYQKLIAESGLAKAPCAPQTVDMLAQFAVLSRLKPLSAIDLNGKKEEVEQKLSKAAISMMTKLHVYDGENMKDKDTNAKTLTEYKDLAGLDEGMTGLSTRFAFDSLADTFNHFSMTGGDLAADPVTLLAVLQERVYKEQLPKDKQALLYGYLDQLRKDYKTYLGQHIQAASHEAYSASGQNQFDNYIEVANAWRKNIECRNPNTGTMMTRQSMEDFLAKLEKPANVANVRDFRNDVVMFALEHRASNGGANPAWDAYEPVKKVIQKIMEPALEAMRQIITPDMKRTTEQQKQYDGFMGRMIELGYVPSQIPRLLEFHSDLKIG